MFRGPSSPKIKIDVLYIQTCPESEDADKSLTVVLCSAIRHDHTHQFHVVDHRVSVLPGVAAVARERPGVDVLRVVEVVERLREQVHRVVDQRGLSLAAGNFEKLSWRQNVIFLINNMLADQQCS